MPRSRGMGQQQQQHRQSPRAPLNLKTTTSSSDCNGVTQRPKLEEHRRSPSSPLPECNQKKRGTRVADLETRLGHAQEQLRKLKEQLASAEAAKRDVVQELEETKKKRILESSDNDKANAETKPVEEQTATVTVEKKTGEKPEVVVAVEDEVIGGVDSGTRLEQVVVVEPIESDPQEKENVEVEEGKGGGGGGGAEEEEAENNDNNLLLKKRIEEAEAKKEELSLKLAAKEEEMERSREEADRLREQVGSLTKAMEELEAEMTKLKVQKEQWRKAANTAAAIISGEDDHGSGGGFESGRRVAERYRHLVGSEGVQTAEGEGLPADSPEVEDGTGGARRRSGMGGSGGGGGIRMLGELWRRKGMLQHK